MRVSLERSGGFTGARVTSAVDTADLPAPLAAAALRALDELASAPPAVPPGGGGQPRYRLTVSRAAGPQVVDVAESQVPAALRPLLDELLRRGQPGG